MAKPRITTGHFVFLMATLILAIIAEWLRQQSLIEVTTIVRALSFLAGIGLVSFASIALLIDRRSIGGAIAGTITALLAAYYLGYWLGIRDALIQGQLWPWVFYILGPLLGTIVGSVVCDIAGRESTSPGDSTAQASPTKGRFSAVKVAVLTGMILLVAVVTVLVVSELDGNKVPNTYLGLRESGSEKPLPAERTDAETAEPGNPLASLVEAETHAGESTGTSQAENATAQSGEGPAVGRQVADSDAVDVTVPIEFASATNELGDGQTGALLVTLDEKGAFAADRRRYLLSVPTDVQAFVEMLVAKPELNVIAISVDEEVRFGLVSQLIRICTDQGKKQIHLVRADTLR